MTASLFWAAARLRRYIKGALVLGLLMAGAGGMVVGVADGAQRASSAFTRLTVATRAPDGYLFLANNPTVERRIDQLPQVIQAGYAMGLAPGSPDFTPVVLTDRRFGTEINGFKYLSGRRPARSDEAIVNFTQARSQHLHVGSTLTMPVPGSSPRVVARFKVVGVVADTRAFPPLQYANEQGVYLDASFLQTQAGQAWVGASGRTDMLAVRVRGGVPAFGPFLQAVEKINGGPVGSDTRTAEAAGAERSMHLQSLALWMTAGFGALVVMAVVSQLLLRQLAEHRSAAAALRSLGMTTAQLVTSDLAWIATVAVVAAVGAALVAWAASPLFPLGTARVAEPHPGFSFDWGVIGPGVAVLAAAITAIGAIVSWSVQRPRRADEPVGGGRPGLVIRLQALPAVMSTGIRFALRSGRGRAAVPARTTIGASAVAIGGVVVAMTFAASLSHLLSTPELYGTTYDADIEMNANFGDVRAVVPALTSDTDVTDIAVADTGIPLRSGRVDFGGEAIRNVKGSIQATVLDGRLPAHPDEIALGRQTFAGLHTSIGRTIDVAVAGITSPLPMKVVGTSVLSPQSDSETLGKGAVVAAGALNTFMTKAPPGFQAPGPGDAFVRFRPGVNRDRAIRDLTARLGGIEKVIVTAPNQPTDVADFGQVRSLPQVLAGLLAALAAATMAYLLVSAIRRRRRELAVLKTVGFVPAQISAAVAWQATTIAAVAMLIGIPIGIVAGRAVWSAVANQMGVVVETHVPLTWLALVVPAAVALANLLAAGPAVVAGRISPARALRDE
jgi:ABC-type antimicrobial peptide transport system permease subunit